MSLTPTRFPAMITTMTQGAVRVQADSVEEKALKNDPKSGDDKRFDEHER